MFQKRFEEHAKDNTYYVRLDSKDKCQGETNGKRWGNCAQEEMEPMT